jgi:predicted short-subunit dehydrogenase-like oxidoreductase (DUF2520 family)
VLAIAPTVYRRRRVPIFYPPAGVFHQSVGHANELAATSRLPAQDRAVRAELEALVFFIVETTPEHNIIRRDYPDGALKTT